MPFRTPRELGDLRSRDQWARNVQVIPDTGSVTTDRVANKAITSVKLRDSAATSVIGRAGAGAGPPADIAAGIDNTFLGRRSGTLGFSAILDGDLPATIARDSEVSTAVTTGITTHEAAADPHPGYITTAEGNAAYVALANVLNDSVTYDPPNLLDGAEAITTVTVTGAALGDFALASFSLSTQGIKLTAEVTAADTVTVNFHNKTTGTLNLGSGTLKVRVFK